MRPSISPSYDVYNFIMCHLIVTVVFWPRSETKPLPIFPDQSEALGGTAAIVPIASSVGRSEAPKRILPQGNPAAVSDSRLKPGYQIRQQGFFDASCDETRSAPSELHFVPRSLQSALSRRPKFRFVPEKIINSTFFAAGGNNYKNTLIVRLGFPMPNWPL